VALSSGIRFGRYEILSELGAGGMGEVYRARDTSLGREVAIKTLPVRLSSDRESLRRLEQEARSASALNHPNIVTIYEFAEVDSTCYIAMELVEGQTLRQLLASGPIPLRQTIQIAAQVAEGLAKAHEAGIVHRDLKPGNLMLSRDGLAKILDFGLAKLTAPESSIETQTGGLLGTVGYVSPEQVSGQPADFRSDQFSFGAILYEMATGKRAFQKGTSAETLVAILREEPEPLVSLNPQAPAPLCWVVERCLAKAPNERYASTRDLARDVAAMQQRLADSPLRRVQLRPSTLPIQRTTFIGRGHEVAAAGKLLLREDVRLVTLTGPGGIGKTRLGLRIAEVVAEQFAAGVFFVPLAPVSDPRLIAHIIAQTLGLREIPGQSPIETLKDFLHTLGQTSMLLVLDSFEHLMPAAPMVADLLAVAPGLKFLVTSRAPLHVSGEYEFLVSPLALPDPRSSPALTALLQCPAVALFVQRATAVKPDFVLTRDNASAVTTICARLDGLPLAIELAAARIKLLSPAAMQTRLESRLQLLTGGARDLPARQQTLRGAIDWSYGLLDAAEQKLFRRLSVFVGGCTLEAAEAVCNTKRDLELDVLDGMASILDKSLQQVHPTLGESRFVMLETIREYGLEHLVASGEEAATRRAHAAYYLVLAEEQEATQETDPVTTEWLDRLELEHDNIRAALEWLIQSRFWEMREHLTEGRDFLARVLKLPGAAPRTQIRARALFAASVLASEQRDFVSAPAFMEESLEIARELGDQRGIAVSLNALAVYARDRGDLAHARTLFDESLAVWRELGDRAAVARSLSNLANVLKLHGEYELALSLYGECLSIFHELGDGTGMAWTFNYQGDVARERGDQPAARARYQASLEKFRELGDSWGIAGTLADLGNLAREEREYAAALSLYQESMKIFQELGQKRGIARLLECFACAAAAQAHPELSLRLAGAAAALHQVLGAPLLPAEQARLEKSLEPARQALTNTVGAAVWMEGWTMPVEKAIEEAQTYDPH